MRKSILYFFLILSFFPLASFADESPTNMAVIPKRLSHQKSAIQHKGTARLHRIESPAVPKGMTLEEVLKYSESSSPSYFPVVIMDNESYLFTLVEQLEYRISDNTSPDFMGWEAQGWYGPDYYRFWWKSEGESIFDGSEAGESENDFLYSRLFNPFWSVQAGVQYANQWNTNSYEDRWSGVLSLQGLAPYKFELDNSLYISERADVTFTTEAEYNIRITQRLVLQPRAEFGFAAQDIAERSIGAGMTDANVDFRLRYEIKRGIAPYIGVRYRFLVAKTADIAEADGDNTEQWLFLAGARLAF